MSFITLNNIGQDLEVMVDEETANILLNDPAEADELIDRYIMDDNEDDYEALGMSNGSRDSVTSIIWSKKKPDHMDHAATELFLSLREKYRGQFDDKKTQKAQIWRNICQELEKAGYHLGENGMERCRQKFANLQKQYLNHVKHMNKTGSQYKEPPPYFDHMHNLLHMKDKVNPNHLQKTGVVKEVSNVVVEEETAADEPETSVELGNVDVLQTFGSAAESIRNRFSAAKISVRPPSTNALLVELFKKQHSEDMETKNRLIELLEEQNKQRGQLIDILSKLVQKPTE